MFFTLGITTVEDSKHRAPCEDLLYFYVRVRLLISRIFCTSLADLLLQTPANSYFKYYYSLRQYLLVIVSVEKKSALEGHVVQLLWGIVDELILLLLLALFDLL
jgi:hypothetical protein